MKEIKLKRGEGYVGWCRAGRSYTDEIFCALEFARQVDVPADVGVIYMVFSETRPSNRQHFTLTTKASEMHEDSGEEQRLALGARELPKVYLLTSARKLGRRAYDRGARFVHFEYDVEVGA